MKSWVWILAKHKCWFTVPYFKAYYKVTAIKTRMDIGQRNKTDGLEK